MTTTISPKSLRVSSLILLAAFAACPTARAGNFYWDADTVSAENQNGNGTWSTSNTNWQSASTAGVDPQVSWTNTSVDIAFIGNVSGTGYTNASTGGTITLGQNIVLNQLSMSSGQTGSYVIDGAGFTLTASSLANNSSSANLTINAVVAGVNVSKSNAGRVILTNANTYTGTTTVSAGTLSVGVVSGASSNLGTSSSAVNLGGASNVGTLSYTGSSSNYTRGFTLGGAAGGRLDVTTAGQTLTVATGGISGTGNFTVGGAGNTAISSGLTFTGNLAKADAGTLTLSAGTGNTYTGTTTISGGALDVGTISNNSLGAGGLIFTGGVLQGNGLFTRSFSGNATPGAGSISGTTGGFAAKGGTLTINFGGAAALVQLSGPSFRLGTNLILGSATADSKVAIVNSLDMNNSDRTITVNSGVGGDSAELQGAVINAGPLSASQTLTKAGAGTLILSANNTYTSNTRINGGTLQIGNGGATGSLNGSGTITNNATLAFNRDTTSGLTIDNIIAGTGAVKQIGTGTTTLTANNTYGGTTTVDAGTLVLSGNASINGSSGIVLNGGTFKNNSSVTLTSPLTFNGGKLGGTNLSGVTLTIGTGQTLAPGNSPGTLVTGSETWNAGGHYEFEINNAAGSESTNWDLVSITGTLTLGTVAPGSEFFIDLVGLTAGNASGVVPGFDPAASYSWRFATATSISGTAFTPDQFLVNTAAFADNNPFTGTFSVSKTGDDLFLNYAAIPEPSSYAALAGFATLGLTLRRRRRAA